MTGTSMNKGNCCTYQLEKSVIHFSPHFRTIDILTLYGEGNTYCHNLDEWNGHA